MACDNPRMKPFIVLSHGLDSGPDATKVSALAQVADRFGLRHVRPDFRDLDASRDVRRIDERIARVAQHVPAGAPAILAGSSMGAFSSGLASLEVACVGLFLIALPLRIPEYAREFDAAEALAHGFVTRLADDPHAAAMDLARAIAARNPDAIRATKRLYNAAADADARATLATEAEAQLRVIRQPNQIEAVRANMEKRAPLFVD